jgi:hypothetical protein
VDTITRGKNTKPNKVLTEKLLSSTDKTLFTNTSTDLSKIEKAAMPDNFDCLLANYIILSLSLIIVLCFLTFLIIRCKSRRVVTISHAIDEENADPALNEEEEDTRL